MPDWSKNNLAHRATWSTLLLLEQSTDVFSKSGSIPMTQLTFWNAATSPDMRKLQINTLARQIDNVFRLVRGAQHEDGVQPQAAIAALIAVLSDPAKTICDLANAADGSYRFFGEPNA